MYKHFKALPGVTRMFKFSILPCRQVVANYAEPMYKYFKALVDHPKFRDGKWADEAGVDPAATVQVRG